MSSTSHPSSSSSSSTSTSSSLDSHPPQPQSLDAKNSSSNNSSSSSSSNNIDYGVSSSRVDNATNDDDDDDDEVFEDAKTDEDNASRSDYDDDGEVNKEKEDEEVEDLLEVQLDMAKQVPKDMAQSLMHKEKGNVFYKEKKYDDAIDAYTIAIDYAPCDIDVFAFEKDADPYGVRKSAAARSSSRDQSASVGGGGGGGGGGGSSSSDEATVRPEGADKSADSSGVSTTTSTPPLPPPSAEILQEREHLSTCFGNRAAAYGAIEEFELVVEDCDKALKLNPKYVKVLIRRYQANEKLDKIDDALADAKSVLAIDPAYPKIAETVKRLDKLNAEKMEKMKGEALGKLKELGNSILGNFGMSLDSFKMTQDPKSGGWNISMNNN